VQRPPEADDALPPEYIRLSEAFEEYYRATTTDADTIEKNYADALAGLTQKSELETASQRFGQSQRAAELSFRKLCDVGFPAPCVRDPTTAQIFELKRGKWAERTNFGVPGLYDDFVWEHDITQPGPSGAIIGGILRPVFFDRAKFEACLSGEDRAPKKRGPKDLYDWKRVKELVFELMDDHGEFSPDDSWASPSSLVEALRVQYFNPRPTAPG
jgi:hypothetical protein